METNTVKTDKFEITQTKDGETTTTKFKVNLSKVNSRKEAESLIGNPANVEIYNTNDEENSVVTEYKSEKEFYNIRKQERVLGNFVSSIKTELSENSKKGDWLNFTDWQGINDEIYYHRQKLDDAMNEGNLDKIKEHIADVSGLYMMLGNSYGLYNKPNNLTAYDVFKLKTWIADLHKVKVRWISEATHLRNGTHDKEKQENNLVVLFSRIENLTGLKISKEEYDNIKTFGQLLGYLKPSV